MAAKLVMFGGSGHARAVTGVLEGLGLTVAAIADPDPDLAAPPGAELVADDREAARLAVANGWAAVLGIGDNERRLGLAELLAAEGVPLPAIVARSATVSASATLGDGIVVMEHAHVGPGATAGAGCVINTGAIVEHDCRLGPGAHCAPGSVLSGGVSVGAETLVGAGASVLPGIAIGERAVVGAGAAVIGDVAAGATVSGVPAS